MRSPSRPTLSPVSATISPQSNTQPPCTQTRPRRATPSSHPARTRSTASTSSGRNSTSPTPPPTLASTPRVHPHHSQTRSSPPKPKPSTTSLACTPSTTNTALTTYASTSSASSTRRCCPWCGCATTSSRRPMGIRGISVLTGARCSAGWRIGGSKGPRGLSGGNRRMRSGWMKILDFVLCIFFYAGRIEQIRAMLRCFELDELFQLLAEELLL